MSDTDQTPAAPDGWTPETAATRRHWRWSADELHCLDDYYVPLGLRGLRALLPARSDACIMNQAAARGLRRQRRRAPARKSTPMLDAAIKRLYAEPLNCDGRLNAFCARYGYTRQWVAMRAKQLGVLPSRIGSYNRPWTPAELALVERFASLHTVRIARRLKSAGFTDRGPAAVFALLKKRDFDRSDPDRWTAGGLARLMGVEIHTVLTWIRHRALPARREPGYQDDRWQITRKHLRAWLLKSADWDHRRVQREFLIEILSGVSTFSVNIATEDAA